MYVNFYYLVKVLELGSVTQDVLRLAAADVQADLDLPSDTVRPRAG